MGRPPGHFTLKLQRIRTLSCGSSASSVCGDNDGDAANAEFVKLCSASGEAKCYCGLDSLM